MEQVIKTHTDSHWVHNRKKLLSLQQLNPSKCWVLKHSFREEVQRNGFTIPNAETAQHSFRLGFFPYYFPISSATWSLNHLKGLPLEPENKQAYCPEYNSPFFHKAEITSKTNHHVLKNKTVVNPHCSKDLCQFHTWTVLLQCIQTALAQIQ